MMRGCGWIKRKRLRNSVKRRKLWTDEEDDSEVKTAYQYVLDLRERLEELLRVYEYSYEVTLQS